MHWIEFCGSPVLSVQVWKNGRPVGSNAAGFIRSAAHTLTALARARHKIPSLMPDSANKCMA